MAFCHTEGLRTGEPARHDRRAWPLVTVTLLVKNPTCHALVHRDADASKAGLGMSSARRRDFRDDCPIWCDFGSLPSVRDWRACPLVQRLEILTSDGEEAVEICSVTPSWGSCLTTMHRPFVQKWNCSPSFMAKTGNLGIVGSGSSCHPRLTRGLPVFAHRTGRSPGSRGHCSAVRAVSACLVDWNPSSRVHKAKCRHVPPVWACIILASWPKRQAAQGQLGRNFCAGVEGSDF